MITAPALQPGLACQPRGGRQVCQAAGEALALFCPHQLHPSLMRAPAAAGGHVLLTREAGKNAELLQRLSSRGIAAVEVPMLETAPGPDWRAQCSPAIVQAERGLRERWSWPTSQPTGRLNVPGRRQALPEALAQERLSWATITSPEAAAVFLQAWTAASHPSVRTGGTSARGAQAHAAA